MSPQVSCQMYPILGPAGAQLLSVVPKGVDVDDDPPDECGRGTAAGRRVNLSAQERFAALHFTIWV
jgi:hypothetical protein